MNKLSTVSNRLRPVRVVLASLVLALAGGAALNAMAQPGPGHHGGFNGGFGLLGGPRLGHLLDSVNATDEQRTQIQQITQAAHKDLAAQRQAGAQLHEQALKLFTQPNVDANAVEALRQQIEQQHDQSSRRITQAMLDVSRVLTPEQRTQLGQRLEQRKQLMQKHQQERRALEGQR